MSKLTAKQTQFVAEYLIDLNATQAAIRAGYSVKTANEQGARLLANVSVRAALQKSMQARSTRTEVTSDRVLKEIARIAFFDPRKMFGVGGQPLEVTDLDDDTAAAIGGLDVLEEWDGSGENKVLRGYVKKYKIADKNSALEKLAKHLGLYEMDNHQKTDALTEVLNRLGGSALPVVR